MSGIHFYPSTRRTASQTDQYIAEFLERDLAAIRAGEAPLKLDRAVSPGRAASIYAAEDQLFAEMLQDGQRPVFRRRHQPNLPPELLALAAQEPPVAPAEIPATTEDPELIKLRADLADLQAEFTELAFVHQSAEAKIQRLQRNLAAPREENARLQEAASAPARKPRQPRQPGAKKGRPSTKSTSTAFDFSRKQPTQIVSGLRVHWHPDSHAFLTASEASTLAAAIQGYLRREPITAQGFLQVVHLDLDCQSTPILEAAFPADAAPERAERLSDASIARLIFELERSIRGRFCLFRYHEKPGTSSTCCTKKTHFSYLRTEDGILAVSFFADYPDPPLRARYARLPRHPLSSRPIPLVLRGEFYML